MTTVAERRDAAVELETRDIRALSEAMQVVPARKLARRDVPPGAFLVVREDGEHVVDPDLGACTCEDMEYRDPEDGCKHLRRVAFETGARSLPRWLDADDCGFGFRLHVDVDADAEAPGMEVA